MTLGSLYEHNDLERAVTLMEEALALISQHDPRRPSMLYDFSTLLRMRSDRVTCSYACWNVVAIFSTMARSIVICLAVVLQEASFISCNCLRPSINSCSASMSAFVGEVSVGGVVAVSRRKFFFPSSVVVGGVVASVDGLGGFWTVIEALVDGLVAVEDIAALLRVWLFVVFLVGIVVAPDITHIIVLRVEH
jgi:hypothetical protein